jgi:Major Facilitator Superfamily
MIGKRFSLFFTALCFAGAFSGLISGAVISGLEDAHGMRGWRWLFLIEGLLTIAVAIVALFILPDYPHNAQRRMSAEKRLLATVRIMHDKSESYVMRRGTRLTPWQSVKAAVVDLRTYFFIILYMTQNGSTTVSYFIPTVLSSMGYSGTMKQWMTIPIWMVSISFLDIFGSRILIFDSTVSTL